MKDITYWIGCFKLTSKSARQGYHFRLHFTVVLTAIGFLGEMHHWHPQAAEVEDATNWKAKSWTSESRAGAAVDRVVIHATVAVIDPETNSAVPYEHWFSKEKIFGTWRHYSFGPHYFIARDGTVSRLVAETNQTSHARGYNARSIGIELAGIPEEGWILNTVKQKATSGDYSYTAAQYTSLSALLEAIRARYPGIKAIFHSDIWEQQATVVAPGKLNVRSGPGTTHDAIRQIDNGASVWVLGVQDGWTRIDSGFNEVGWVNSKYLAKPSYAERKKDPGSKFDQTKLNTKVPFVVNHDGTEASAK